MTRPFHVLRPLRPTARTAARAGLLAAVLVCAVPQSSAQAPNATGGGRQPAQRATRAASLEEPATELADLAASVRDRVRLQNQATRARERLKVLGREADALARQQRTLLGELRQLELQRERHAAEEAVARASERLAQAAIAESARQIARLEAEAEARAPAVRARVSRLYEVGHLDSPRYWVRSAKLAQAARGWRLLAAVATRDRQILVAAVESRTRLESVKREQQAKAAEAATMAQAAQDARAAAGQAVAARQALLVRLDRERDLAARLVGELEQAEERLRTMLTAPAEATLTSASPAEATAALLPLAAFKGDLEPPVTGPVLTRFGRQRDARFGTVLPRNGVELGGAERAPVRAVHEGRVVFSDSFAGLGRLVIVEHGPSAFSLYGHLGEFAKRRGDAVSRGTAIGSVGRTPAGSEAIYFELRIDGQPVDPLEWMKPVTHGR